MQKLFRVSKKKKKPKCLKFVFPVPYVASFLGSFLFGFWSLSSLLEAVLKCLVFLYCSLHIVEWGTSWQEAPCSRGRGLGSLWVVRKAKWLSLCRAFPWRQLSFWEESCLVPGLAKSNCQCFENKGGLEGLLPFACSQGTLTYHSTYHPPNYFIMYVFTLYCKPNETVPCLSFSHIPSTQHNPWYTAGTQKCLLDE